MNRIVHLSMFGIIPSLLLQVACGGTVEVGEAKGGEPIISNAGASNITSGGTNSSGGSQGRGGSTSVPINTQGGTAPTPNCEAEDAEKRGLYEAWLATPNDLGPLAGKTFAGYVEGGPDIVFTIAADGAAALIAGEPAPAPQRDKGYLCDDSLEYGQMCLRFTWQLVEGGTYPLHGAKLSGSRLTSELHVSGAFDAWCALQTPKHEGGDGCFYQVMGPEAFSFQASGDACSVDSEPVSCSWLALAEGGGPCSCTSTECFTRARVSGTPMDFDARVNDTADAIDGSFRIGTHRHTFHLELAED